MLKMEKQNSSRIFSLSIMFIIVSKKTCWFNACVKKFISPKYFLEFAIFFIYITEAYFIGEKDINSR